jgi:integration host factor subunit beta
MGCGGGDWMTKAELIDKISEKKLSLTRKQVEVVVNTVLDGIKDALSRDDKVEIRGFGSFRIRHRRAKEGRNPKTGEAVSVPPKKVPFFKAGKEMREMVDGKV